MPRRMQGSSAVARQHVVEQAWQRDGASAGPAREVKRGVQHGGLILQVPVLQAAQVEPAHACQPAPRLQTPMRPHRHCCTAWRCDSGCRKALTAARASTTAGSAEPVCSAAVTVSAGWGSRCASRHHRRPCTGRRAGQGAGAANWGTFSRMLSQAVLATYTAAAKQQNCWDGPPTSMTAQQRSYACSASRSCPCASTAAAVSSCSSAQRSCSRLLPSPCCRRCSCRCASCRLRGSSACRRCCTPLSCCWCCTTRAAAWTRAAAKCCQAAARAE